MYVHRKTVVQCQQQQQQQQQQHEKKNARVTSGGKRRRSAFGAIYRELRRLDKTSLFFIQHDRKYRSMSRVFEPLPVLCLAGRLCGR